ncbi:MAG: DUF559 domain-containing protein [Solirubrobacterales bacterium]|nr:DUF559 domain-containing protein [Solirubrobacterales bacterium]
MAGPDATGSTFTRAASIPRSGEVDALWPGQRLIVELDGFAFHRHRAAFERDRARDAALQATGYRVVRLTHRRLEQEDAVATQLRDLLHVAHDAQTLPNAGSGSG